MLRLSVGLPHPNDYGIEMSVSCHAETSHGKQLHLEHTTRVGFMLQSGKVIVESNAGCVLALSRPYSMPLTHSQYGTTSGVNLELLAWPMLPLLVPHMCFLGPVQGEDLRVLPKAKLGSNHWMFLTAAVPQPQLAGSGSSWAGAISTGGSSNGSSDSRAGL